MCSRDLHNKIARFNKCQLKIIISMQPEHGELSLINYAAMAADMQEAAGVLMMDHDQTFAVQMSQDYGAEEQGFKGQHALLRKRRVGFDVDDEDANVHRTSRIGSVSATHEANMYPRFECEWCREPVYRILSTACIHNILSPSVYEMIERTKFGHYECVYPMAVEAVDSHRADIKHRLSVVLGHYNSRRPVFYRPRAVENKV